MRKYAKAAAAGAVGLTALAATTLTAHAAPTGTTYFAQIRNSASNLCLQELPGGGPAMRQCNAADNDQKWEWSSPDFSGRLRNRSTGRCLHSNGISVYALNCSSSSYQLWVYVDGGYIVHGETQKNLASNPSPDVQVQNYSTSLTHKWY